MFRIISGQLKGKRLIAPKNITARPTTDFAKEALFGILAHRIKFNKCEILDLFAGIGSISFEFASRGCPKIYMLETNKINLKFIFDSIKDLDISNQISVIAQDVFSWLPKNKESFDIIFADPPYEMPLSDYEKLVNLIFEKEILKENGFFILEHGSKQKPIENEFYHFTRKYGNVSFSFYSKTINIHN